MDNPIPLSAAPPEAPDELQERLDALGRSLQTLAESDIGEMPAVLAEIVRLNAQVRVLIRWTKGVSMAAAAVLLLGVFLFLRPFASPPPSGPAIAGDGSATDTQAIGITVTPSEHAGTIANMRTERSTKPGGMPEQLRALDAANPERIEDILGQD